VIEKKRAVGWDLNETAIITAEMVFSEQKVRCGHSDQKSH
jgi:hypothetical protein